MNTLSATILSLFLYLLTERAGQAYPVKLTGMTLRQGLYKKNVFLFGDCHSPGRERSKGGHRTLKYTDRWFKAVQRGLRAGGKKTEVLPLIWEMSYSSNHGRTSKLYINRKGAFFAGCGSDCSHLRYVASDQLRRLDPFLAGFMLDSLYRPTAAKTSLQNQQFRNRLNRAVGQTLFPGKNHLLTASLRSVADSGKVPAATLHILRANLEWYRSRLQLLRSGLRYSPDKLWNPPGLREIRQILVHTSEDLELLFNIFSAKENTVLVYAGRGHVRRLQKLLFRLGFHVIFDVEKRFFLTEDDFFRFEKLFLARSREHPRQLAAHSD